jgi:hypothetical protein
MSAVIASGEIAETSFFTRRCAPDELVSQRGNLLSPVA